MHCITMFSLQKIGRIRMEAQVETSVDAAAPTITTMSQSNIDMLQNLGENVVYLMGFSFILGCLFTILILIMLDVMRRSKTPQ